ncbi:MAG: GDP-mannose 4,6-dehydratase [Patescibacteria group bacterium]|nr:GDP-mannose 4,6-dehydratase [Patescibacteria group bacterium]
MSKRILVTGGAGFVGHHFIDHLLKNTDWEIIVLDSLNYAGNLNRITDSEVFTPKRVKFVWHDLQASISDSIHKLIGKLDYCVHFAAESHVDKSLKNSIPFVMSNVLGTANLLEYFKHHQPKCKTLIFSTDEVFGSAPEGVYFKEEDTFKPSNPYSGSKAGEEMMAYSFAHSFKLPISIIRSMNIIGERQHVEKFIPKVIRAISNNQKVIFHGRGRNDMASRCWIHARNVSDGLLFLLDRAQPKEFYHIVGEEKTVLEIADWICELIKERKLKDEEIEFVEYPVERPGHDKRYALCGEKLAKMGWKPPRDLEESLKKTIKWTLEHPEWLNL